MEELKASEFGGFMSPRLPSKANGGAFSSIPVKPTPSITALATVSSPSPAA